TDCVEALRLFSYVVGFTQLLHVGLDGSAEVHASVRNCFVGALCLFQGIARALPESYFIHCILPISGCRIQACSSCIRRIAPSLADSKTVAFASNARWATSMSAISCITLTLEKVT